MRETGHQVLRSWNAIFVHWLLKVFLGILNLKITTVHTISCSMLDIPTAKAQCALFAAELGQIIIIFMHTVIGKDYVLGVLRKLTNSIH